MYIQPDVQMYYLLDYDKHEEIEQKGRAAAALKFKVCRVCCATLPSFALPFTSPPPPHTHTSPLSLTRPPTTPTPSLVPLVTTLSANQAPHAVEELHSLFHYVHTSSPPSLAPLPSPIPPSWRTHKHFRKS